jgi:hypothetical protein
MRAFHSRLLAVVALVTAASAANAMTIRPLSDAQLAGTSDVIVLGTVAAVASGESRGRIVTWVDIAVERSLKGRLPGSRIRLTEAGGRAGDRRLVIPGAPDYTVGERVVVFARVWGDRLLRTNSFALGKFTVVPSPGGVAQARRGAPAARAEPLDALLDRIRTLVGDAAETPVPDGFVDGQGAAVHAPFQIGLPDGAGNVLRGRWVEAECGVPVPFSLGNLDPVLGAAGTHAAVDAALAAWTTPDVGQIELFRGPDLPLTSIEFLRANTIVFEDPFDEILDDLVGCEGVLAIGGFFMEDTGALFERIVQGLVILNEGVSACLDATGVAETLAHEIGHAIGFGHSSENPNEPNPTLEDALMYFLIHDDGRGAQLAADDLAGLATLYPAVAPTDPVTDGLARLACLYDLGPLGIGCGLEVLFAEAEGRTLRLRAAPIRKYRRAAKLAARATRAPTVKKARKLVRRSRGLALKSDAVATRLFDRDRWPEGCFVDIHDATGRAVTHAEQLLPLLDANL